MTAAATAPTTALTTAPMIAGAVSHRHLFASLSRAALTIAWLLCLALWALPLHAQNRAFFDRDRIALDETVLLTIQAEGITQGPPDFGEFLRDFRIVNLTSEPQMEMVNGRMSVRIRLLLELQPTREGVIDVPPFRVGGETIGPFRLTVLPPRNAPSTEPPPQVVSEDGPPVMLQSTIEAGPAYVQQSVGYVVRLYFEPSKLIDGKLDQAAPEGASLLRVGDDIESDRMIGGRQFRVVERRFLVVPNRPGRVQVPAPKFEGRGISSMFDEMFGNGGGRGAIKVNGESRSVQVRPIPTNAPQPWLPVRSVTLRYLAAERAPRVGEATKVTVEMVVDGANAVMLPELQLTVDGDAQVFSEPAQTDEGFVDDRPRARMVREFSVVPAKSGALRVAGPRLVWWDVQAGVARTASLPDLRFDVAPATGTATPVPAKGGTPAGAGSDDASYVSDLLERFGRDPIGMTSVATLAALWAMTLAWALRLWLERRRNSRVRNAASASVVRGYDAFAYKRLFDNGTLVEIAAALCAMAQPAAKDLDHLRAMLDDPAQRAAIDALQRARWSDGAIIEARAQLRSAFADGPRWRTARVSSAPSMLPPLYPEP
jgi:BatD DUF11 like domain